MYDVALSFAGEDRAYVEKVAEKLRHIGLNVFYDNFAKTELWGKDLYEHLSKVYKDESNYVVMFISKHYAKKAWPSHERKSAQAKAFREHSEYILPARFDNTVVPGILETTGYVELSALSPEELAKMIADKVRNRDYWQRELASASHFCRRVLDEAHRGAFLWRKDVTAVFDNRVADIEEPFLLNALERIGDDSVLAQSRKGEHPIVFLLSTDQASEINETVWNAYEELWPSDVAAVQRQIADRVTGTVRWRAVNGPET